MASLAFAALFIMAAATGGSGFQLDDRLATSQIYWLSRLPVLRVSQLVPEYTVDDVLPHYTRFVQHSADCNERLASNYNSSLEDAPEHVTDPHQRGHWIGGNVVARFTILSTIYFRNLPGFSSFDPVDQQNLIEFGQSSSRILAAATEWFDAETQQFANFLPWRSAASGSTTAASDLFKQLLVNLSIEVSQLQLDATERAMANALVAVASDYPDLKNPGVIEQTHQQLLSAFHSYLADKYYTPTADARLAELFRLMPEMRRLGLMHYLMMKTTTLTAEELQQQS